MDFRTSWLSRVFILSATLIFIGAIARHSSAVTCQPDQTPVATQLENCLAIAKQGNKADAFELAQQVKNNHAGQRMFMANYVNTLVSLVESQPTEIDIKIINEAISAVNNARDLAAYDGTGDPEVAFHFMNALSRLGSVAQPHSETAAGTIRVYAGEVAAQLRHNVGYPRNALEALAKPLIEMAKTYAARQDSQATFSAIHAAVNCGFGEYQALGNEPWLAELIDDSTRKQWTKRLDQSYRIAIENWSRTVLRQFGGASFNFSLNDIEGGRVSSSDFAGKVTVIDLWATWCPPCRKGIPHYVKLQTEFRQRGVEVVGISMDDPENPNDVFDAVKAFADRQAINYPIAIGDTSIAGQFGKKMAFPTTVFVDRSGRVRFVANGYHDYAKVKAITKILVNESQTISAPGSLGENY